MANSKTDKKSKTTKTTKKREPTLDISSLYSDTLDTIEKRQGVDSAGLDVAPPMSTGLLQIDMILGGGIRSSMLTGAGNEQCAKTTLALTAMASAIKENIPIIAFVDYEGCFTADTLVGYGRGKQAPLSVLYDLSQVEKWAPGTWIPQQRMDIDTVEVGHISGTSVRTADLYYRGKMPITRLTLENGMSLKGYHHPVFVVESGVVVQKRLEDLRPGDDVLVKK